MSFSPVLLGATAAFCWGTADFLSRRASKAIGYYRTTIYVNVVAALGLVTLTPLLRLDLNITPFTLLVLSATSILGFFAGLLLYRAFQDGAMSLVAPVIYSYPAITVILAVVFLHEALFLVEVGALTAVIVGVVLTSTKFSELKSNLSHRNFSRRTPAFGTALAAAVMIGTTFYGTGFVIPLTGYLLPAFFSRVLAVLLGVSLGPVFNQTVRPSKGRAGTIIAMGVLETVGILAFNVAVFFSANSLPVITAVAGSGGAFIVTYAVILLGERLETNQIIGIILASLGVGSLLYLTA